MLLKTVQIAIEDHRFACRRLHPYGFIVIDELKTAGADFFHERMAELPFCRTVYIAYAAVESIAFTFPGRA